MKEEKVDGYLEWRLGDVLVADGQRIRVVPATKFKGKGEAKAVASIPLGYELKAKGAARRRGRPGGARARGQAERVGACSRAR